MLNFSKRFCRTYLNI